MERDPASLDDLGHPLLEVLQHEVVLVRAVDEKELDRLVEVVGGGLGERRDRRHELGDPRALDVRAEVAEPVVGVRVDREDGDAGARLRAEAETDRRLPLPGADLGDHAAPAAPPGELVERLALLVREPAGNVRDQRLDALIEFGHARTLASMTLWL